MRSLWRRRIRTFLGDAEPGRLRRWAVILIEFSAIQAVVQLVGAVTGIVVVRSLDAHGYALYTIANSALAVLVALSDSGIGSAVLGIGGRVWQDPARLARVLQAARDSMRRLRNVIVAPIAFVFAWLLLKNGARVGETGQILVLVLLGAALSLRATIDMTLPRLTGSTRFIQTTGLASAGSRLIVTSAFAFLGLLVQTAMVAVVAGLGVQSWATWQWTRRRLSLDAPADADARRELSRVVKTQFPNALNFVFQAQISIWLLSVFGSATSVADLGAVTRIGVLFSVFLATMQNVAVPRYARCQDPHRLSQLYLQIVGSAVVVALAVVAVVAVAPDPLLWILGPQYAHLPTELVLAVLSTAIGSLCSLAWSLNANRAWFPPAWIWIPIDLLSQLGLALLIGVATTRQVLTVSVFSGLILLAANVAVAAIFIRRFRHDSEATPTCPGADQT